MRQTNIAIALNSLMLNKSLNILGPDGYYLCFPNPITQKFCGKIHIFFYNVLTSPTIAFPHAKFSKSYCVVWSFFARLFLPIETCLYFNLG